MKYYKKNFLSVNKIKILIIVRLASKRLKNKAKKKVGNYSITEILILRLLKFFDSTSIIICTTRNQNNTFLKKISLKYNTSFFAGAEKNIFKRIIDCEKKFKFNNFVRVTGDNPLTDAQSIIQMTKSHIKNKNDFTYTESLPLGMRPEIISMKALIKASKLANDQLSSEYLTYFFLRKGFRFKKVKVRKFFKNENNISVTVDFKKDLEQLKKILKSNIYITRKNIINKLKKKSFIKKKIKIIPVKTKLYDVSFKNDDQENNYITFGKGV